MNVTFVPANLKGLEHTTLKEKVIPNVMETLNDGAHIAEEAHHIMNNHSIMIYQLILKLCLKRINGLMHMNAI